MDKDVSCNHVQFAMRVLFCLFVCFGGQVTVMDMGGQIILLVYTGWTQSDRIFQMITIV